MTYLFYIICYTADVTYTRTSQAPKRFVNTRHTETSDIHYLSIEVEI